MGLLGRSKDDSQAARPEFDLVAWAGRHGLEFRDGAPQAGYLSVTCPWSVDLLFNVVRGRWPGGTYGVLCHEVRIFEPGTPGYYYGERAKRSAGSKAAGAAGVALDVVGVPSLLTGGRPHVKVPHTSAGARVPHLSTITGLHVARADERCTPESSIWRRRPLDDLELADDWVAAVRKHSDDTVAERLIAGPVREILSTDQGAGFELRVEWGQAVVSQQDFLEPDDELDALVTAAERFAGGVGEICVAEGGRALDEKVIAPEWLQFVADRLDEKHTLWPVGALLERVVQIAADRGLAVEDPRSFHQAFPRLNVPGEAFGVLRGRLPGTSLDGRLLCAAERPMVLPDEYRRFLTDPGGAVGCDVAVVAVDPATSSTPPEGEVEDGLRFAVGDGVLTVWRTRPQWQADGASLDALCADVAALAQRRGISPSTSA